MTPAPIWETTEFAVVSAAPEEADSGDWYVESISTSVLPMDEDGHRLVARETVLTDEIDRAAYFTTAMAEELAAELGGAAIPVVRLTPTRAR